jgi:hypothetical protein
LYERLERDPEVCRPREPLQHGRCARWRRRRLDQILRSVADGVVPAEQVVPYLRGYLADAVLYEWAWERLERHGGPGAGPDGVRYGDVRGLDRWMICRRLAAAVDEGNYVPGPERQVRVPKSSGNGHRTLSIMNVADRVAHKGVAMILPSILDRQFSPRSYGFRPRRDRRHALAEVEREYAAGRRVFVAADLKDAFDRVPVDRLLDALGARVGYDAVVRVVRACLQRQPQARNATRGIRQGSSLSPVLLNVYLDHFLDRPWALQQPATPLLRYADDLLMPCRDRDEANAALEGLRELLRPTGMELKDPAATGHVFDLRSRGELEFLGFALAARRGELVVTVGEGCYQSLARGLDKAHERPHPAVHADQVVRGWIDQLGPCFQASPRRRVYDRFVAACRAQGFDEFPRRSQFERLWRAASRDISPRGSCRAGWQLPTATNVGRGQLDDLTRLIECRR